MHPFYSSHWPRDSCRFLAWCWGFSLMLAIFQLPAHAQGRNDP